MKNKEKTIDNPNMRLSPTTPNPELNIFIIKNKEIINVFEKMNKCHGLKEVQELFESFMIPKMLEYGFSSELYKTTAYYTMTFKNKEKENETTITLKLNYEGIYGGSILNLVQTNINYSKDINVLYTRKNYILEFSKEKTFIANNLAKEGDENGFEYFRGKDEALRKHNNKVEDKVNFDKGPMAIRKIVDSDHIKIDYLINYKRKRISVDYVYLNDINDKILSEISSINKILKNNYEEFIKVFAGKANNIKEICELDFIDTDISVSKHFEKNNEKFINLFSKIEKIKKLKQKEIKNTI